MIAYEPVWAIGTGVTATPQQVRARILDWFYVTLWYTVNEFEG